MKSRSKSNKYLTSIIISELITKGKEENIGILTKVTFKINVT